MSGIQAASSSVVDDVDSSRSITSNTPPTSASRKRIASSESSQAPATKKGKVCDVKSFEQKRKQKKPKSKSTATWLLTPTNARLPPASIDFETGETSQPDTFGRWEGYDSAQLAAKRKMLIYRHVGSVFNMKAEVAPQEDVESIAKLFQAPIKRNKYKSGAVPGARPRCWDRDGEPPQKGPVVTVARILCADGVSLHLSPSDRELLIAINSFANPDILWKIPLSRVLICKPLVVGDNFFFDIHVYFSRLVFYLIANPATQLIMSRLEAANGITVPTTVPPLRPHVFNSVHDIPEDVGDEEYPFTLDGILKTAESPGYNMADPPAGMKMTMKDYQKMSLQFMIDREESKTGLNNYFWETRTWRDGGEFYYSPQLGELRIGEEKPPIVRGGLLCDEMGMGKTLVVAALMARDKITRKAEAAKTTLVVAPDTLIRQWESEIYKSTSKLVVMRHESSDIVKGHGASLTFARAALAQELMKADVVITSYRALVADKTFQQIHWRRICLDEMQEVRSSTTKLAKACITLRSDHRWMISGKLLHNPEPKLVLLVLLNPNPAPFYTSIDDLHGELAFLKVIPFSLLDSKDGFYSTKIGIPWHTHDEEARKLVEMLLKTVMIRHSKSQTTLDGRSILELPAVSHVLIPVQLTASERAILSFLEALAYKVLPEVTAQVELHHNDHNTQSALELLQYMRDMCISANLINGGNGCKNQLVKLERMVRRYTILAANLQNEENTSTDAFRKATAAEARDILMQSESIGAYAGKSKSSSETRDFRDLGFNDDFVRHTDTVRRNYASNRSFAIESIDTRMTAVNERIESLKSTIAQRAQLPLLRWKWAVASITSGRYCPLTIDGVERLSWNQWQRLLGRIKIEQKLLSAAEELENKLLWASVCEVSELREACNEHNIDRIQSRSILTKMVTADLSSRVKYLQQCRASFNATASGKSALALQQKKETVSVAVSDAQKKLEKLLIYQEVLLEAKKHDEGDVAREKQDKFSGLNEIAEGLPAPRCPICLSEPAENPIVTPCVHIYCRRCFLAHMAASHVMDRVGNDSQHTAKCPLCRRACTICDTIELVQEREEEAIQDDQVSTSLEESKTVDMDQENNDKRDENENLPQWHAAAHQEDYDGIAVPNSIDAPAGRVASLPSLPASLLAHLCTASGVRCAAKPQVTGLTASSKILALLKQLEIIFAEDVHAKVVVFTSIRDAIPHISRALSNVGIDHTRIVRGDSPVDQEQALSKFIGHAKVLLLHAGAAAAGLTLTMAHNCILMEPFLKSGEELQALNRCHRIGQQKNVRCVTLYVKRSFEERILASRNIDHTSTRDSETSDTLPGAKLRQILGLLE